MIFTAFYFMIEIFRRQRHGIVASKVSKTKVSIVMALRSVIVLVFLHSHLLVTASTLHPRAWQVLTNDSGFQSFPEASLPELNGTTNSAICVSGGGTRSFIAATGMLRSLLDIEQFVNVRYLVGVSGGSWAVTAFSFHAGNTSDKHFLGNISHPRDLSLDTLSEAIDSKCARSAALHSVIDKGIEYFLDPRVPDDEFWERAVGSIYLEPFGIPPQAMFTWSQSSLSAIAARDPSFVREQQWVMPAHSLGHRPYPVVMATILGPASDAPFHDLFAGTASLELSPLYIGHWRRENVSFPGGMSDQPDQLHLGGLLESYAFGSEGALRGLVPGEGSGVVQGDEPKSLFPISKVPGTSSWMFGGLRWHT